MNKQILAVSLASLLVGGVAVAAYNSFSNDDAATSESSFVTGSGDTLATGFSSDVAADRGIGQPRGLDYAEVVRVEPVREKQKLYATVIGTDPVRETSTVSSPRQVCEDVVVQERLPERDGNVGGTIAGALLGGALGNQVGGGNGKKAATIAGAVAGGFAGRNVDQRHVGGRVVERVDRQCRTVSDSSQTSRVVGYNVTFRNPDGTTGTMRTDSKPGSRIPLGSENHVVGYDVTYRYMGTEQTVRMDERPGQRLPVVDGEVVVQTAALTGDTTRG
ncbi:MAG: glycine zipper 2TM domain-containing protein [Lysobacter sp.]|nr:glycine zipper 2TM domain-containing protein [Lysobacter sp.]MDQ3269721.1 glycine zipper 2TM domain-containing protein [Pseudomonadota bacterium]